MKRLLFILLVFTVLIACNSVVPDPPPPPDIVYRALFVGVSDYIYSTGLDLNSPAGNTYKLQKLFQNGKREFESITRLTNQNATKQAILDSIQACFGNADDDDVSYFYFMGHGSGDYENYPSILPADFNYTFSTYLTVHELEQALSNIKGTKVVLLETCHAGNFIERHRLDFSQAVIDVFSGKLDTINKEGYQVLCSSAGDEYSYDSTQGSFFCRYFIEGCEGLTADNNDDRVIDMTEIYEYLKKKVTMQTAQLYPEGSIFGIYEE